MTAWYVYIVRCADDTLYTGVTNRLEARLQAHNDGKGAKYTRSRRPVVLEWSIRRKSRGAALSLEYAIKQLSRRQKQAVIRHGLKVHAFGDSRGRCRLPDSSPCSAHKPPTPAAPPAGNHVP